MKTIRVFVPGTPKAQPRTRATIRGNHAGVFDPGTANGWKDNIKAVLLEYVPSETIVGAVDLSLSFRMPRPKAHYRTNGEIKDRYAGVCHIGKPDLSNMLKAVEDALTDVGVWRDDSQIMRLGVEKIYHPAPGVWIELTWDS